MFLELCRSHARDRLLAARSAGRGYEKCLAGTGVSVGTAKRLNNGKPVTADKWIPIGVGAGAWTSNQADLLFAIVEFTRLAEVWGFSSRTTPVNQPVLYLFDLIFRSGKMDTATVGRAFYSAMTSSGWSAVDWEIIADELLSTIGCLAGRILVGLGAPKAATLAFSSVLSTSGTRTSERRHFASALAGLSLASCTARNFAISIGTAGQLVEYLKVGPGRILDNQVRSRKLLTAGLNNVRCSAGQAESNDLLPREIEHALDFSKVVIKVREPSLHSDYAFYFREAEMRLAAIRYGPDSRQAAQLRDQAYELSVKLVLGTKQFLARAWMDIGKVNFEILRGKLDSAVELLEEVWARVRDFPSLNAECFRLFTELQSHMSSPPDLIT